MRITRRTVASSWPAATISADRAVLLDVGLEDRVEHLVGRQRVLVRLVGPELGRGRARERALGDRGRTPVAVPREPVDHGLVDVLQHREAARRVAVERAVAHRGLALVAGREHEPAELVRQRHQVVAADARLQVLLGDVARAAREGRRQRAAVGLEHVHDRDRVEAQAERAAQRLGVLAREARRCRGPACSRPRPAAARARRRRCRRRAPSRCRRRARAPPCRSRSCARSRAWRGPARRRPRPRGRARAGAGRAGSAGFAGGGDGRQLDARQLPGVPRRPLPGRARSALAGGGDRVQVEVGDDQVLLEHRALGQHLAPRVRGSGSRRRGAPRPGRPPGSRRRRSRGGRWRGSRSMRRRSPALPAW